MKWGGTVLTVLLLVVWVGSAWWGVFVDLPPSTELFVDSGVLRVAWDETWAFPNRVEWWGPEPNDQNFEYRFGFHTSTYRSWAGPMQATLISIPIWSLVCLSALPTALLWYRDRRRMPGLCVKCGYDLRGNASGVCPECGGEAPRELKVES